MQDGGAPAPMTLPSHETTSTSAVEFRFYRRLVSTFVLLSVSLGSAYLLMSIGVSIYRRRHAVPSGDKVSAALTDAEIRGCFDELQGDVTSGLQKHLENFHHLLASTDDPAEAQRWADEGAVWREQWKALGSRCRFDETRRAPLRKELGEMAAVYDELGVTRQIYTQALLRYGKDQAPRLGRIRQRLQKIGERLATPSSPSGP